MRIRKFTVLVAMYFLTGILQAQTYTPSASNLQARTEFQDDKFGMFIHWGPSSILGAGEWVMHNRNIQVHEYKRLQQFFNPQQFKAAEWVATVKAAGMKYITFISRHHDGFSNWDTQQSDWNIPIPPIKKISLNNWPMNAISRASNFTFIIRCSIGTAAITNTKQVVLVRAPGARKKAIGKAISVL
jgi:hypothetical protein